MSADKLVDSTQLDSDLTSVADAIRAKSGGSSQLAFPAGFVSEIQAIPSGQIMYYTSRYMPYVKDFYLPALYQGLSFGWYQNATYMESLACDDDRTIGGGNSTRINNYFKDCTSLKTVKFPHLQGIASGYTGDLFAGCTSLETVVFGSIGHPLSSLKPTSSNDKIFNGLTQSTLTITVFVNASTLADVPAEVKTYAPWGATNATIIYKSSVDGSVLT